MTTTFLLVDDHELFRQGLQLLLETNPQFQVIGQAESGADALAAAEQLHPDIVVLDMLMPGMNGLETIRLFRQNFPDPRLIVLSMSEEEAYVYQALREGAQAYILKDSSAQDLVQAVQAVLAGRTYLSPRLAERAIAAFLQRPFETPEKQTVAAHTLTPREREVLQFSAEGLTASEIAKRLALSPRTVETHRANLMHKLGLHSQQELILYARQNKLIPTSLELGGAEPPPESGV